MPDALKIFLFSLIAAFAGAAFTSKFGMWLVERFFPREPMAVAAVLLASGLVAIASAVTTGVVMGKKRA
ncbi:MAG: hypothetical protein SFW67_07335 [Myxococcaceae bacterium]|nr:hypothetical protein [Myxococcaceae bacterium]